MTLVVDASVALKWFVAERDSDRADALLGHDGLCAPELLVAEVLNAARVKLRRGEVVAAQVDALVRRIEPPTMQLLPLAPIARAAMDAARVLDHPVYDCFYLALAERAGAELVTADRRLLRAVQGSRWASLVVPLDDFAA